MKSIAKDLQASHTLMWKSVILEIICLLYIILFLYTGLSKLLDYSVFKEQIATSIILAPISQIIAISLPFIEFGLVISLLYSRWRRKGLYSSLVLMTLFTIYIICILNFSDKLPCSCGGILNEMSWTQHLIFNSLFIVLAIAGIILEKKIKLDHLKYANNYNS